MNPNLKQRIIKERIGYSSRKVETNFILWCGVCRCINPRGPSFIISLPKGCWWTRLWKCVFFLHSQLPTEIGSAVEKNWDEFLRLYRNPIERVINSFPEQLNGNGLMHYMQFVSSAHEYMDDFSQMYQELFAKESGLPFKYGLQP